MVLIHRLPRGWKFKDQSYISFKISDEDCSENWLDYVNYWQNKWKLSNIKNNGLSSEIVPFFKIYFDSIVCLIMYDTSKHSSKLYLVSFVKTVK